jgi:hypothetical protein
MRLEAATLCGFIVLGCTTATVAETPSKDFLGLGDLTREIVQAISEAKLVSDQPPYFIIKKVNLKLKGELRTAADGSVEFTVPIFGAGADLSAKGVRTVSSTTELDLVPKEMTPVGGTRFADFIALIRVLKQTFNSNALLNAGNVTFSESWALQLDANGKVNLVVAKAGAEISSENSEEITFVLCQTLNRSDCISSP